jgi:superfamily II RNA helicase
LNESGRRLRLASGQHRPVPLEFLLKQKAREFMRIGDRSSENQKKMSPLISRSEGRRSSSLPKHMRMFREK